MFYLFEQRTVPGAFCSLPENWNFFHWENFVKIEINGNLKVQCLGHMVEESELTSQDVMIFVWSSKKQVVLCYPDERLCIFCRLFLDASHWVLLSVGLTGSSTSWNWLVFWKELIIEDSHSIPPYTQHHFLWMKTGLWCGWRWFILLVPWSLPFHIIEQYPFLIACHNLF